MRLTGRRETSLLVVLALALTIAVAAPLAGLLVHMHALERQSGVPLFLLLSMLVAGLLLYGQGRKHDEEVRSSVSEVVKREAGRRTSETQRLVSLGQAVARALDHESIRTAINQHLPRITGVNDTWVLIRQGPGWELLAGPAAVDKGAASQRVAHAEDAVGGVRAGTGRDPRPAFPMIVGGTPVGVIGMEASGPIDEERERMIEAAASFIAVALKNVQHFRDVRETGVRDGLTGCWTRTHAMQVLDSELRRARRSKLPVSVILFDLDHFKSINDRYGHLCGDAVLAEVGRRFHEVLRSSDLKCRYGGEEFLGVLAATSLHGAGCVAEELRREICGEPILWNNERLVVSASLGVTQADPGELDIEGIIGRADAALYRAKQQGRNRVRFEPDAPPPQPQGRTSGPSPPDSSNADDADNGSTPT